MAHQGTSNKYDAANFTIRDVAEYGSILRRIGEGAESMEETSGRIVRHLFDNLIDGSTGERAISLARFFLTRPFKELDEELREFARGFLGGHPENPDMKCLVLLSTAGENPDWNSREKSKGHKAIPLSSEEAVYRIPMIKNLIKQLGIDIAMVVKPDMDMILDMKQKSFNVFYVPDANGCPFIPAQKEFVIPYGIKSVLGFGGLLSTGDIFVINIFFKIPVLKEVADLFIPLSLNVKLAVLPFENSVFKKANSI